MRASRRGGVTVHGQVGGRGRWKAPRSGARAVCTALASSSGPNPGPGRPSCWRRTRPPFGRRHTGVERATAASVEAAMAAGVDSASGNAWVGHRRQLGDGAGTGAAVANRRGAGLAAWGDAGAPPCRVTPLPRLCSRLVTASRASSAMAVLVSKATGTPSRVRTGGPEQRQAQLQHGPPHWFTGMHAVKNRPEGLTAVTISYRLLSRLRVRP